MGCASSGTRRRTDEFLWPNIQTNHAHFARCVSDPWNIILIALGGQFCVTVLFSQKKRKSNETALILIYANFIDDMPFRLMLFSL